MKWVSCSWDTNPAVAPFSHITLSYDTNEWVDTLCGASRSPGAFKKNSTKPECLKCVTVWADRISNGLDDDGNDILHCTQHKVYIRGCLNCHATFNQRERAQPCAGQSSPGDLMSGIDPNGRYFLLGQIEAHWGRMLRQSILREADLEVVRERHPESIPPWKYEAIMEALIAEAQKAGEAIDAAYRCPDDLLPVLKNWQTNDHWREMMIERGYYFDVERMIWMET